MNVKEISLPIPKNGEPMTNEEWFDTLSTTEEKAEAIYKCVMANSWSFSKDGIKRWLKQPHTKE